MLAGEDQRSARFSHYELVTSSLARYMQKLVGACNTDGSTEYERFSGLPAGNSGGESRSVCYVTHISRSDIIQGLLGHRAMLATQREEHAMAGGCREGGGLIIAGSSDHQMEPFVQEYIKMARMPVLRSYMDVTKTMSAIRNLTPKMQAEDSQRVQNVIQVYERHLDLACDYVLR